ncbi:MAG: CrcB family protein, partial [Balneola sp.]
TLLVNVSGSFAIGVVFALLERQVLHPDWRGVLMVGFLGAFTTFSTFSLEAITLWESGQAGQAAGYVLASVVLSLLAAGVAITLTRALL